MNNQEQEAVLLDRKLSVCNEGAYTISRKMMDLEFTMNTLQREMDALLRMMEALKQDMQEGWDGEEES